MLTGSNLRKEMLRQNIPVYDRKTKRFDQPYAVGDCAGEGMCVPACFFVASRRHTFTYTHMFTHTNTHIHTHRAVRDLPGAGAGGEGVPEQTRRRRGHGESRCINNPSIDRSIH